MIGKQIHFDSIWIPFCLHGKRNCASEQLMPVCPQARTHTHTLSHTSRILFILRKHISKYDLNRCFQCKVLYLLTSTRHTCLRGRFGCDFDRLFIMACRPRYGTVLPACHSSKLGSKGCVVGITVRMGTLFIFLPSPVLQANAEARSWIWG